MHLPDISSILLFGTDNVIALSVIRAIGTALPHTSIYTLSTESDEIQISNYSKFVSRHHSLKSLKGEELLREVILQIKNTGAEILLPIDEDSVRFVSIHFNKIKNYVKLPPLSSADLLESVINKDKLADLLLKKGYQTPETYPVKDLDPISLPKDFFPCLLKPIRGSGGRGFKRIDDLSTFENLLLNNKYENFIIQKLIHGRDIDCSLLAVDGEIKAHTIQRGLAQDGYSFSKALRFKKNKRLFHHVEQFIRDIGYSGIAHLDYIFDNRDGMPKLIDFNARYWSTLEGSKVAGIDFTLLNCLEAMNVPYSKPGFKCCNYLLGRSVFSRFKKPFNRQIPTFTDLKSRISDPLPELLRIFLNSQNIFHPGKRKTLIQ